MGKRRDRKKSQSISIGVSPYNMIADNVVLVDPECPVCMVKLSPSLEFFIEHMSLAHRRPPSEGECYRFRGLRESDISPLDKKSTSVYTLRGRGAWYGISKMNI